MIELPSDDLCVLNASRIVLSPMVASDADELFELLVEPSLYEFTGGAGPVSVEELREQLRKWESRHSPQGNELWLNWTLRLRGTGTLVGYVQASIRGSRAELAWVVGLPHQGKGYASEASQSISEWLRARLGVEELRANIQARHLASQAVARKLGLEKTPKMSGDEEVWSSAPGLTLGRAEAH
ncbi:MAG: N-acetyltransferase [Chloroflexi bacterium]|nr:N-acetyltransferase [Chloroflexota bacterium]